MGNLFCTNNKSQSRVYKHTIATLHDALLRHQRLNSHFAIVFHHAIYFYNDLTL